MIQDQPVQRAKSEVNSRDDRNESTNLVYSIFSNRQKQCISWLASMSAMYSGLSSFIYYPAVTALSRSMGVSIEKINLSITSYQIVSGIAPSVLGDLADQVGRRPICLLAFILYFGANLGLAMQNDYASLMALRCLQSAGSSTIAYGFIADLAPPASRGSYVGILQGFTNSAPSLGPILGGILTEKVTWHWIFWLLAILSGSNLVLLLVFMPETSRLLVGNGSRLPPRLMNVPFTMALRPKPNASVSWTATQPVRLYFPNPFNCLKTLWQKASFVVILVGGIQYTIYGCIATSLSTLAVSTYGLNYLQGGLTYLPSGIGGVLAAVGTGRMLDKDYIRTAKRFDLPIDKQSNDLDNFPIEKARLLSIFPLLLVSAGATIGFGWALERKTHIAVPLVMTFVTGASQVAIFTICGTLLTDLNADRSATVQASYSLVRCSLSAAGIAVVDKLIVAVGVGWCFTIFSIIGAVCTPLCMLLRQRGWQWRREGISTTVMPLEDVTACNSKPV